ncbi:MAG: hypothetical protein IKM88_11520 [Lachnospiraceae bacterium]|nr:hypothetical protein [Lachnospiraceae bacterium]MBR3735520.1 hypothetical protein [Lachnospiraceae bacterium]MBR6850857.1 hypothetical protein [Lachnospiraceae bacterium]
MKNTSREEMRNLKAGDTFWINGTRHTASVAAALCGDAEFSDEFIVYDENDEGWFESDFEERKPEPDGKWPELEHLQKIREELALLKNHQRSFAKADPMYLALATAIVLMERKIEEWEKEV